MDILQCNTSILEDQFLKRRGYLFVQDGVYLGSQVNKAGRESRIGRQDLHEKMSQRHMNHK